MSYNRETILGVCAALSKANPTMVSVILIGSVARDAATPKSDVDLLLVGETKPILDRIPPNFHIHAMATQEFMSKLREGDDLAAWSVRYGVPIQDDGKWDAIVGSDEAGTWPSWQNKVLHATRRLLVANTLLATGDVDSAAEEALFAAGHVTRALLLRSGVFPLSRAELIKQSHTAGHVKLADILAILLLGEPDDRFVRRTIQYLKKLLIQMDKSEFRRRSSELSLRSLPSKKKKARTI
jgi:Nucleotidyltransferase domain